MGLRRGGPAGPDGGHFFEEGPEGQAVEDHVVGVEEQTDFPIRFHHRCPAQGAGIQVEGLDEILFVGGELIGCQLEVSGADRVVRVQDLDHLAALLFHVGRQNRVGGQDRVHGPDQGIGVGPAGAAIAQGHVVDQGLGIFGRVVVDAQLGGRQGHGIGMNWLVRRWGRSGTGRAVRRSGFPVQQIRQDGVLDGEDGAVVHEVGHVEPAAEVFIQFGGQHDHGQGGQAHGEQVRVHAKIVLAREPGDDGGDFLFQPVEDVGTARAFRGILLEHGLGQLALVHLAVGVQRDGVDGHDRGRRHVFGQLFRHEGTQFGGAYFLI